MGSLTALFLGETLQETGLVDTLPETHNGLLAAEAIVYAGGALFVLPY